jgi:uncharacterized SAM-binding protein YcdF (DUF218 family)
MIYIFLILLSIFIGLILFRAAWLPQIYSYLDVSNVPQPSNVIAVLGGGDPSRSQYATELYFDGFAPLILISGYTGTMEHTIDIIVQSNIPESSIIINNKVTSTFGEAEQILAILQEINANSALIVTNRFHTRRALATYHHIADGNDVNFTIVSPNDGIKAESWWQLKHRTQIIAEYPKMIYYLLTYGVWSG